MMSVLSLGARGFDPLGIGRRSLAMRSVLLVLGTAVLALASPHLGAGRFPDTDDVMRLVQVRDLLGGQGWFDLYQHRMNPPEGTLMHWSRLVDAPLAGVREIAFFPPMTGG